MLALGGLMISAAVLGLAALVPVFRDPDRPRWARWYWAEEMLTLVIVCGLAFGIGCLGAGAIRAYAAGPQLLEVALLGVVLFVSVWLWRRLAVRRRLGARETRPATGVLNPVASADTSVAAMATSDAPPAPGEPPPLKPSRPTRRAA